MGLGNAGPGEMENLRKCRTLEKQDAWKCRTREMVDLEERGPWGNAGLGKWRNF